MDPNDTGSRQEIIATQDARREAMLAAREAKPWLAKVAQQVRGHYWEDATHAIGRVAPELDATTAFKIAGAIADRLHQLGVTDMVAATGIEEPGWDPTDPAWSDDPWERQE